MKTNQSKAGIRVGMAGAAAVFCVVTGLGIPVARGASETPSPPAPAVACGPEDSPVFVFVQPECDPPATPDARARSARLRPQDEKRLQVEIGGVNLSAAPDEHKPAALAPGAPSPYDVTPGNRAAPLRWPAVSVTWKF